MSDDIFDFGFTAVTEDELETVQELTQKSTSSAENLDAVQYKIDNYGVGVYGELCDYQYVLSDGDRIELYRQLKVDAKEQRKMRAKEQEAFAKPDL